jgi:phosphonate transport system substrate-binding protein
MPIHRRPTVVVATLISLALVLAGCGSSSGSEARAESGEAPETLRVALLPDENASDVIKNNEPLRQYLEDELGVEVDLIVTTDYSSMIEAMARGRLELGYFGPLSYVLAQEKSDIEPFAAMQDVAGEAPTYRSVIVGNPDVIKSLEDIAGKTVAWGDPASTSSHLIPKAMLVEQADLNVDEGDYQEQHVGAHDAVALAVQNGNAEAGGLSKPIYERLVEEGIIDPAKVPVIAESVPYPNYPWTMQASLPEDFKEQVRNAFLELDAPEVLEPFSATGFEPISDEDYDVVRELAPLLDIDLADFQ